MLYFFVKIYKKEEWADDLMAGRLYANRLSYFRTVEKTETNVYQGDPDEGAIVHQRDALSKVVLGKYDMSDDVEQIKIQMDWMKHLNLFCVYAGHSGCFKEISQDNLAEFRRQIEIPGEMLKFGNCAVVIRNTLEFIGRVEDAIRDQNFALYRGLVRYYDPDVDRVEMGHGLQPVLHKPKVFSYQKEYRFVIGTGTVGDEAVILDIGDISDIAVRMDAGQVNASLNVKIADDEPPKRLFRRRKTQPVGSGGEVNRV